jgi:hypothetical protein
VPSICPELNGSAGPRLWAGSAPIQPSAPVKRKTAPRHPPSCGPPQVQEAPNSWNAGGSKSTPNESRSVLRTPYSSQFSRKSRATAMFRTGPVYVCGAGVGPVWDLGRTPVRR